MAKDEKAAPPKAQRPAKEGKGKPVSLHPLTLEEAVDKLFKVRPENKAPAKQQREQELLKR
jgi:hypothetical protein